MQENNAANRLYLTNEYSICSKYSAIKAGYFDDPLLEELVEEHSSDCGKGWRRGPLVNRGYAARLLAVDWIVDSMLQTDSVDCFVILGAGYDTLALRKANGCCWVEVDLPQVVEKKATFIRASKILNFADLIETSENIYVSEAFNYHLIACDMRNTQALAEYLKTVLSSVKKTIRNIAILNEVCLCYIERETVCSIFKIVKEIVTHHAQQVRYIGFEQVKPGGEYRFSQVMEEHFQSLGYPLKYFPTREDLIHILTRSFGCQGIDIKSMFEVFHKILEERRKLIPAFRLEAFDEFEELDLYLSHYAVVTASAYIESSGPSQCFTAKEGTDARTGTGASDVDPARTKRLWPSSLQRFGHSSCLLSDTVDDCSVFVTGGFGILCCEYQSQKRFPHKRLNDAKIFKLNRVKETFDEISVNLDSDLLNSVNLDKVHGQVSKLDRKNIFFFNGGRQSPIKHNQKNTPFLAKLDGGSLSLTHLFSFQQHKTISCWRHRVLTVSDDLCIQVGGLNLEDNSRQPLIMWNFSSDKLGYTSLRSSDLATLNRHSFALDKRDANTFIIVGGLETNELHDKPALKDTVLWDMRTNESVGIIRTLAGSYGSDIHFINENQFLKLGGISLDSGLNIENVDMVDLRKGGQIVETCQLEGSSLILTNSSSCRFGSVKEVATFGGGGSYFTFGTCFNKSHLIYSYV